VKLTLKPLQTPQEAERQRRRTLAEGDADLALLPARSPNAKAVLRKVPENPPFSSPLSLLPLSPLSAAVAALCCEFLE